MTEVVIDALVLGVRVPGDWTLEPIDSPTSLTPSLQSRPPFPPVSCSDRSPGREPFLPKPPGRQMSFRAPARFGRSIRKPGCAGEMLWSNSCKCPFGLISTGSSAICSRSGRACSRMNFLRRFQIAIEIDRADQRFERVGQGRRPLASAAALLATSHQQIAPQIERLCVRLERVARDETRTQFR